MSYREDAYEPWHFHEVSPNSGIKCATCDQYYYNLAKVQAKTREIKREIEEFQRDCALNARRLIPKGEFSPQRLTLSNARKDAQIDAKTDEINALQTRAVQMQAQTSQAQKKLIDLETELRFQEGQSLVIASQAKQQEALIEQLQLQLRAQTYEAQHNKEQRETLRESLENMQRSYDSQIDQLRRSVGNYETSAAMRDFVAERTLRPVALLEDDAFEI